MVRRRVYTNYEITYNWNREYDESVHISCIQDEE